MGSTAATLDVVPRLPALLTPGRRGTWLLVVARCPFCHKRHTHRAEHGPATGETSRLSHCLDGGQPYRLVPTTREAA
ncbi:hypothetical protein [Crossiella sp. CA198]|uniref:hypothetical protein n=1 Tax=Crossiella sp. CA198 TaxID=3455607 RepID=UPI003F8D139F